MGEFRVAQHIGGGQVHWPLGEGGGEGRQEAWPPGARTPVHHGVQKPAVLPPPDGRQG